MSDSPSRSLYRPYLCTLDTRLACYPQPDYCLETIHSHLRFTAVWEGTSQQLGPYAYRNIARDTPLMGNARNILAYPYALTARDVLRHLRTWDGTYFVRRSEHHQKVVTR